MRHPFFISRTIRISSEKGRIDSPNTSMLCLTKGGNIAMEKDAMILGEEEQFAREVTLGVIVERPVKIWSTIIPGMFIIDFLRRQSTLRKYVKYFMFPRKKAIRVAQALLQGEQKAMLVAQAKEDTRTWLTSLGFHSDEIGRAQLEVLLLLVDHYKKLLQSEGDYYHLLIRNAYARRADFQKVIDQISRAEKALERAITAERSGDQTMQDKLKAEAEQIAMRRQKMIAQIY